MAKGLSFTRLIPLLVIITLSCFLFLWRLGAVYLTNWDEAWYADISRTISERGNIFSPVWNGRPFLEKPPLSYWLTSLSYRAFGDNEFSARFVSAFAAIATVFLVFEYARRRGGNYAALISAFLLLSTPAYLWRARTGDLDSLLTLLMTSEVIIIIELQHNKKNLGLGGLFVGLAFLTKGSIAFIFPVLGILYYSARGKKPEGVRVLCMTVIGVIIAALWALTAYFINGRIFLDQFLTQQGEKIGSPVAFLSNVSFAIFGYLRSGLKYWLVAVIPAVAAMLWSWRKNTLSFVALCAVVFFVLLTFLKVQSSWFLMPIYPLLALSVGWSVAIFAQKYSRVIAWLFLAVAVFQLLQFRNDYFVPDVSQNEALVALASGRYTKTNDVIFLTHYYYPTAVYYSRRITYAVYSDHPSESWWILSKDQWPLILKRDRVFINTNSDDFRVLQSSFPSIHFEVLFRSGDKLLVRKV